MKKLTILLGTVAMLGFFTSCEDMDVDITVKSKYYDHDLVIPPAPQGEYIDVTQMNQADVAEMLEEAGQEKDATVNKIYVDDVQLNIDRNSAIEDFTAVDDFYAIFDSENVGQDTVAATHNRGAASTKLTLDVYKKDIKKYFDEEEFNYKVAGVLNQELTDTLKVKVRIRFEVIVDGGDLQQY